MDILYKAGEDDDLGRTHLGTLVLFHVHGPLKAEDALARYGADELALLLDRGYLEQDKAKTLFKIKGMADDENEIKETWTLFYKSYPGTKTGINVELKHFRTKWKAGNRWRSVLPTLNEELQRQIAERAAITLYNETMAQSGQSKKQVFLPEWKNLKTWINQGCWDESRPVPQQVRDMAPAPAPVDNTPAAADDSYGRYKQWALAEAKSKDLTEVYACSLIPLRGGFEKMMAGEVAPFIHWEHYTTRDSLKQSIMQWTREFFSSPLLRSQHQPLMDHYAKRYLEDYRQE